MRFRLTSIFLFIITVAAAGFAQTPPGPPRQYDPKTEATVSGVVDSVTHPVGRNGMAGIHLSLKTETGMLDVHVGPQAFVEKQGFSFRRETP